jgi:hypothetical protein
MLEQGSGLPLTPSADPDERHYRIRLLPQVITRSRDVGYG